jgi:hypothetical protein
MRPDDLFATTDDRDRFATGPYRFLMGRIASSPAELPGDALAAHVALMLAGAAVVAVSALGLFLANGAAARLLM